MKLNYTDRERWFKFVVLDTTIRYVNERSKRVKQKPICKTTRVVYIPKVEDGSKNNSQQK